MRQARSPAGDRKVIRGRFIAYPVALAGSALEMVKLASLWLTLAAVLLLLAQQVLWPRLTDTQRRAFDVAALPLLSMFAIYILLNFIGTVS